MFCHDHKHVHSFHSLSHAHSRSFVVTHTFAVTHSTPFNANQQLKLKQNHKSHANQQSSCSGPGNAVDVGGRVQNFPHDDENDGDHDQANEHPHVPTYNAMRTARKPTKSNAKERKTYLSVTTRLPIRRRMTFERSMVPSILSKPSRKPARNRVRNGVRNSDKNTTKHNTDLRFGAFAYRPSRRCRAPMG